MNLLLVLLVISATAGCIFLIWFFFNINKQAVRRRTKTVIIIVKEQEPWVEGFIRNVFHLMEDTQCLKVQVLDDGSSDKTREILRCLQRYYPFELLSVNNYKKPGRYRDVGSFAHTEQFDVRGLTGKDLLRAPLFFRLTADGAGKTKALSK